MTGLPKYAQTVIIGGGSIGCNTAYHLTKLGMKDVGVLKLKPAAARSGLVISVPSWRKQAV